MSNTLFIVSGMSGGGKTTIFRELMENEVVSFTTRLQRTNEINGFDYIFLTKDKYDELFNSGGLAEWSNYGGNFYGITMEELDIKLANQDAFVIVDVHGMEQLKKIYPKCVTIFLYADYEEVKQRMILRGESDEFIEKRLSTYHGEMMYAPRYDYVIKNRDGKLSYTVNIVKNILLAEQTKLKLKRKSWDAYFMSIAEEVATRSTCDRLNVGTVIVKDKRIVSTGYNGSITGEGHCDDVGHLYNEQERCIRTIHSEVNALLHANREDVKGATAYVTHECCENCAKALVQAGVTRIVFQHGYNNKYNHNFTKNVEWVQL